MKTLAIALNTSREAIRNRILYTIMLFAFLLTGIAGAFGSVSLGDNVKFVKDFSLFSISIFGVVTTVVLGVSLLGRELDKRTIYNLLSKPVARWQFLLGKFLGLLATLTVMMTLMSAALLAVLGLLEGRIDWALLPAVGAMLFELAILLALAIFFSTIVVTPVLTGLFTIGAFVAGRSAPWLMYFLREEYPASVRHLMGALYVILPHLDRFYVADRIVSGQILGPSYYLNAGVYAIAYITILMLLSAFVFRRREFV